MTNRYPLKDVFQAVGASIDMRTEAGNVEMAILIQVKGMLTAWLNAARLSEDQAADLKKVLEVAAEGHVSFGEDIQAHARDFATQILEMATLNKKA